MFLCSRGPCGEFLFVWFAGLYGSDDLFFCCVEGVPSFSVMHPSAVGFAECPAGPFSVKGALWVAAPAA